MMATSTDVIRKKQLPWWSCWGRSCPCPSSSEGKWGWSRNWWTWFQWRWTWPPFETCVVGDDNENGGRARGKQNPRLTRHSSAHRALESYSLLWSWWPPGSSWASRVCGTRWRGVVPEETLKQQRRKTEVARNWCRITPIEAYPNRQALMEREVSVLGFSAKRKWKKKEGD